MLEYNAMYVKVALRYTVQRSGMPVKSLNMKIGLRIDK